MRYGTQKLLPTLRCHYVRIRKECKEHSVISFHYDISRCPFILALFWWSALKLLSPHHIAVAFMRVYLSNSSAWRTYCIGSWRLDKIQEKILMALRLIDKWLWSLWSARKLGWTDRRWIFPPEIIREDKCFNLLLDRCDVISLPSEPIMHILNTAGVTS